MEFDAFAGPERGLDSNLSETLNYSNEFERFDDGWIDRPIFTRFRLIAARNPGKIALDDGVLQLTYQDVLRVAQNLALHVEATVPKGRPIGIFLPNGSLFPAAALACLAAGRLYVPIDQNYPPERTDQIIREARLAAIYDRGPAPCRIIVRQTRCGAEIAIARLGLFALELASTSARGQRCKAAFPVRILSSAKSQQSTTVCVHANR